MPTMEQEGTIGIHQSLGGDGARFGVVFSPYVTPEGSGQPAVRRFSDLQQVVAFLKLLGICKDWIGTAFQQLAAGRSARIPNVVLSEKKIQRQGLETTVSLNRRIN